MGRAWRFGHVSAEPTVVLLREPNTRAYSCQCTGDSGTQSPCRDVSILEVVVVIGGLLWSSVYLLALQRLSYDGARICTVASDNLSLES